MKPDKQVVDFDIPKNVPSGKYLVRVESIALHQAQSVGGAQVSSRSNMLYLVIISKHANSLPQIYLSCAQVEVTGGGNGTPGPLVSFPGAYRSNDQGLLWSYYPVKTSYTAPGPKVWQG